MCSSPIRLLVVEDNPADAKLLEHTLAESSVESFQFTHVELMTDATERLTSDSFDAILLDLSLPDSRGIETIGQINAVAPHLPIVVMTGLDDEATAREAVRRGAQDFLLKGHGDCRVLVRAIRYAMERKQAEQQLKALNETLEQRVAERTAVATRRAAQLQVLATELTQTEHRERRRLAQILHDHLQQLLYAARLNLDALRRHDPDQPPSPEAIDQIDAMLGECIAELRALTVQLCPPVLHESGLVMAVEWLARHMEQTCGLMVDVKVDPQAEPESEEIRILLFEAARELLFNVVKHAETGHAQIALTLSGDDEVCLTVFDQGAGFIAVDPIDEKADVSGFGLFSIRERLELMGGRLQVEAAPGQGTRVTVWAPFRGAPTAARSIAGRSPIAKKPKETSPIPPAGHRRPTSASS